MLTLNNNKKITILPYVRKGTLLKMCSQKSLMAQLVSEASVLTYSSS